jgi:putative ABC transport system substrate-binding protein
MLGIRRREFIAGLGGAAAWPLAARAQQGDRVRRIAIMTTLPADDPEWQTRGTAFVQGLQELGWSDGRNVRIEHRWPLGDRERLRNYAAEFAALAPDVILAGGATAAVALRAATRTVPIVFAGITDPVANGLVASLARPGGNATGFMGIEFGVSAKSLELLKQIAPHVTRVAVVRVTDIGIGPLGAIQAVAPALSVELTPIVVHEISEIDQTITAFIRGPGDGLIVVGGGVPQVQRDPIIALAARYRLPAVYPFRGFVTQGGLISYGIDVPAMYRLAAGYVDRILKGEKPADLPVQAPTKYEMVLNLKTAKALGLDVPASVFARANEVIE